MVRICNWALYFVIIREPRELRVPRARHRLTCMLRAFALLELQ